MFDIKLVKPDTSLVDFYNNIWVGKELPSYKTHLLLYGETDSSKKEFTIEDIRPLVYEQIKGGSGFKTNSFNTGDAIVNKAIESSKKNLEFSTAVRKINGIYHTHTSKTVVNTLNSNWKTIKKDISSIKSEKNINESRKKQNDVIDILADGNSNPNRYSFATKFCSFIAEGNYFPIFDSISSTLIYTYLLDSGYNIDRDNLGLYRYYLEAYDAFIEEFYLQGKSYKEIDKFLWLYGTALSKITLITQSKKIIVFSSPSYINKEKAKNTTIYKIAKNNPES